MRGLIAMVMLLGSAVSSLAQTPVRAPRAADVPETVLVTLRAKPGQDAALADVIARHHATAQQLNLALPSPVLTLRAADDKGRVTFTMIFSWRDASVPDGAPPEIQAIWQQMNALTEARDGRPGLEFEAVTIVGRPRVADR